MSAPDPVVVTGLGCVTPLGIGVPASWRALLAGESGVRPILEWDASALPSRIAAWIPGGSIAALRQELGSEKKATPRVVLALAAAREALVHAALPERLHALRAGLWVGTRWEAGDLGAMLRAFAEARANGRPPEAAAFVRACLRHLAPEACRRALPQFLAATLAARLGIRGPTSTLQTACTSSAQALGEALRALRRGEVDLALAGGVDHAVTPLGLQFYAPLGVLSQRNEAPKAASCPFDATRDGFVLADGAAILVLERRAHARARGALPLAECAGYGTAADAYRITDEAPDGRGAVLAIGRALSEARLAPEEIGYVNAHGTSTPLNDLVETRALKTALGRQAFRVPVSSTKSMTGHPISASGALEATVCVLALRDQMIPPTINLDVPDPECDLDYVPKRARRLSFQAALSNSFGFGGHADCVVFLHAG